MVSEVITRRKSPQLISPKFITPKLTKSMLLMLTPDDDEHDDMVKPASSVVSMVQMALMMVRHCVGWILLIIIDSF